MNPTNESRQREILSMTVCIWWALAYCSMVQPFQHTDDLSLGLAGRNDGLIPATASKRAMPRPIVLALGKTGCANPEATAAGIAWSEDESRWPTPSARIFAQSCPQYPVPGGENAIQMQLRARKTAPRNPSMRTSTCRGKTPA